MNAEDINTIQELKDIKKILENINEKIDTLMENREIISIMQLSQLSLKEFLEEEPNIYTLKDIKKRYK